jgi:hypothetical protein
LKEARQQQVEFLQREQELKNKEAELELSVQKNCRRKRKAFDRNKKIEEQRIQQRKLNSSCG